MEEGAGFWLAFDETRVDGAVHFLFEIGEDLSFLSPGVEYVGIGLRLIVLAKLEI